jgi:hypothetical protein
MRPFIFLIAAIAAAFLCLSALAVLISGKARAHQAATGWAYDQACCSGQDCEALPVGSVEDMKQGWHVRYTSKRGFLVDAMVPYGRERDSQDGQFHGCAVPDRFLCLYAPRTV